MREIKFRAWDKASKQMLRSGEPLFLESFLGEMWLAVGALHGVRYPQYDYDNYQLMQYTGLKDKNGIEIYEGDVLEHSWKPIGKTESIVRTFEVGFYRGSFSQHEPGDGKDVWEIWYDWDELEVIGNIMENPELLK